jgi:hypothetical protein
MKPMIRRISALLQFSVFVTCSLLLPVTECRTVMAAEVKLTPSCELKEEFNDNVFLTSGKEKSDFISTLSPGLAFSRTTEHLNIDLLTGVDWRNYARSSGIDTFDYQYAAQMGSKLTPRDNLGLSATYVRSSRPDSINQATALATNSGSDHYQYSANARRSIDETTSAALSYSFAKDMYDNPVSQANHVHSAGLIVSKDLGAIMPLLKGSLSTNFSRAIYRDSNNDNYSVKIATGWNINEKLAVNLSAGEQLVHSTYVTTYERSNDSWRTIGTASLNYTGEKSFGSFTFVRDFSNASGQVGAVETTSFGLTLGKHVSDKITAQVAASYNINQASSGQYSPRSADDRVLNLKTDIIYKMSNYFDIGCQYVYYAVNYSISDVQVARNSVMLRAVVKYPVTW